MSSSYKVALIASVGICVIVIGYYMRSDNHPPRTFDVASAPADANRSGQDAGDPIANDGGPAGGSQPGDTAVKPLTRSTSIKPAPDPLVTLGISPDPSARAAAAHTARGRDSNSSGNAGNTDYTGRTRSPARGVGVSAEDIARGERSRTTAGRATHSGTTGLNAGMAQSTPTPARQGATTNNTDGSVTAAMGPVASPPRAQQRFSDSVGRLDSFAGLILDRESPATGTTETATETEATDNQAGGAAASQEEGGQSSRTPITITPAPAGQSTLMRTYTIQSGDTLTSIAVKVYGSSRYWVDIARANPTVDPFALKLDAELRLPNATSLVAEDRDTIPPPTAARSHVVRSGDVLSTIAAKYYGKSSQWRVIYYANRDAIGNNPNNLRAGMELTIPPTPSGD